MTTGRATTALLILLPMVLAAEERCPWLNAATAGGVIGGEVRVTVTPTACEFVRQGASGVVSLRIEVTAVDAPHAHCGPHAEQLKAIGNHAEACSYESKSSWAAEQVVGSVRDHAFLIRIATDDRSAMRKMLRERARGVAEAVAGSLF